MAALDCRDLAEIVNHEGCKRWLNNKHHATRLLSQPRDKSQHLNRIAKPLFMHYQQGAA
jgi:hypothetical protein